MASVVWRTAEDVNPRFVVCWGFAKEDLLKLPWRMVAVGRILGSKKSRKGKECRFLRGMSLTKARECEEASLRQLLVIGRDAMVQVWDFEGE